MVGEVFTSSKFCFPPYVASLVLMLRLLSLLLLSLLLLLLLLLLLALTMLMTVCTEISTNDTNPKVENWDPGGQKSVEE